MQKWNKRALYIIICTVIQSKREGKDDVFAFWSSRDKAEQEGGHQEGHAQCREGSFDIHLTLFITSLITSIIANGDVSRIKAVKFFYNLMTQAHGYHNVFLCLISLKKRKSRSAKCHAHYLIKF